MAIFHSYVTNYQRVMFLSIRGAQSHTTSMTPRTYTTSFSLHEVAMMNFNMQAVVDESIG